MKTSASHWQVLCYFWRYARRQAHLVVPALLLLVLGTGTHLAQPFFYREAVDAIVGTGAGDAAAYHYALQMVLLSIGVGITAFTITEGTTLLVAYVESRIVSEAQAETFARVQLLSTKFHINAFAGATARKIKRGAEGFEQMADRLWFNLIPLVLFVSGLTAIMFHLAQPLGYLVLGLMIAYCSISMGLNLVLLHYFKWTDEQDSEVMANLVDTLGGNALVKAFVSHEREEHRHWGFLDEWRHRALRSWHLATSFAWIQSASLMLVELCVLYYALRLWYEGEFSTGTFVMMNGYIGLMWGYMRQIGNNLRDYLRGVSHAAEMVALAQRSLDIEDIAEAKELQITGAGIHFNQIRFHYDQFHEDLFTEFALDIKPREKVALVGHSGSGKSTLIKLLLRLYDVNGGEITIDDQNIAHVTQHSLRESMSLVPQDPVLFHRSIAENIGYGKPAATMAEIQRAARYAHAHEFIRELPYGYDTLVGERGVKLSGGERQRVAIARAIVTDKPILILDEATSSLDSVSETLIQEAIERVIANRTAVIIAHRLSTVRACDRIAVLDQGTLIACAPHQELLKNCPIYKEMVDLQSHGMLAEQE